jgi:hypothetical protein
MSIKFWYVFLELVGQAQPVEQAARAVDRFLITLAAGMAGDMLQASLT